MLLLLVKADGEQRCACIRAKADALKAGDLCVADIAGRHRFCKIRAVFRENAGNVPEPTPRCAFVRAATADDFVRREANRDLAGMAMKAFDVETAGAPQKPHAVSACFDVLRKQLRIVYHADRPFDTRRVESALRRRFGSEVAARQAGIRDEVASLGSIGPCGRPVCCACALADVRNVGVNVRMAKRQNVSLNPASLNGQCDRLKCCLGFEDEGAEP
jgi:cell fate regulator YaaT (PSP1 superfamily)